MTKLSKFVYVIKKFKTRHIKTAASTYYAALGPSVIKPGDYDIILWDNRTNTLSLFTLQKKLIKILKNRAQTDDFTTWFYQT